MEARRSRWRQVGHFLWGAWEIWGLISWLGGGIAANITSFVFWPFAQELPLTAKVLYGAGLFVAAVILSVLIVRLPQLIFRAPNGCSNGQSQSQTTGPSGTGGQQAQASGGGNTQIQTGDITHGDVYNIHINITPEVLEGTVSKQQSQQPNIHVESYGQQGGITAGIVNILGDLGPKVELTDITHTELPNGHRYETILTVGSTYSVPEIRITAYANSIQSLDVAPQRGGMHMFGHTGKREGYHFTTIQNAAGKYRIRITTVGPEQVKVDIG